jgi:DNA-binding transcriptional MocR family regulator
MTSSNPSILGFAYRRYNAPASFGIAGADRLQHLYCVGQTGTGKSTLLSNLMLQDARHGTGFCLIDPHGDLAEQLHLNLETPHLYWDVGDPTCPLGYNPLGKVFSYAEILELCNLCIQHDVLCISDDVYEHMVFDENKMIRVATLPGMWERTITIGSAGKTFSVTGWKLGWAYGPPHLIQNCGVVHQNCVYACPTPIQEAVARGFEKELARLESADCYFRSISVDLAGKRDFVVEMLDGVGMKPVVPEGGYFIMADWSSLADRVDLSSEVDIQRDYR